MEKMNPRKIGQSKPINNPVKYGPVDLDKANPSTPESIIRDFQMRMIILARIIMDSIASLIQYLSKNKWVKSYWSEYEIIESDKLLGSIRIPIETDLQFQRAFSPSFDRLPIERTGFGRAPL